MNIYPGQLFWKHRRAYNDVDKERWMTKDDAEHLEHEAKKPKDHEFSEVMWSSDSSGYEDLHGM